VTADNFGPVALSLSVVAYCLLPIVRLRLVMLMLLVSLQIRNLETNVIVIPSSNVSC